jgi:myosin heavy subunit
MRITESTSTLYGEVIPLSDEMLQDELMANDEIDSDDLIELTHLHKPAVVSEVQKRDAAHAIYTNLGPILLGLNPIQYSSSLYSDKVVYCYLNNHNTNNSLPLHDALP